MKSKRDRVELAAQRGARQLRIERVKIRVSGSDRRTGTLLGNEVARQLGVQLGRMLDAGSLDGLALARTDAIGVKVAPRVGARAPSAVAAQVSQRVSSSLIQRAQTRASDDAEEES